MSYDEPTDSDFAGPCPRCGAGVPNDVEPGKYPGALSCLDNQTYICSQCGMDEAMFEYVTNYQVPLPPFGQLAVYSFGVTP